MLDVTDRPVVIIGGGAVAVRKVTALLQAGATRVRVVAPAIDGDLPADAERVQEAYRAEHLDGAGLVFALTDSTEVNDAVVRDARARGVLVNRGDDGGDVPADFINPASAQVGQVILSVAAGSPALGVVIRDDLEQRLDRRHVAMAEEMVGLRPFIRRQEAVTPQRRAMIFRDLATAEALDTLQLGGSAGLRKWISGRYPEVKWTF
jgi:precorrin-2 dehydrogenase/sirohydrochlorin ferrochelatase